MTSADVLTDDELLALSATTGSRWPMQFPTVELSSEDAVRQAVLRGRRSLRLRQLHKDAEAMARIDRGLGVLEKNEPGLWVSVVTENGEPVPALPVITAYSAEGSVMTETLQWDGVHELAEMTPESLQEQLVAFIETPLPESGLLKALVNGRSGEERLSVAIGSEVRVLDVAGEQTSVGELYAIQDVSKLVSEAMRWL